MVQRSSSDSVASAPHARPASSQQRLTDSIVRQIQSDLPAPDSSQEVAGSVEAALLRESRDNEITLAYLRVVGLGALTALGIAGYARPELIGAGAVPLVVPLAGTAALLVGVIFLLLLRNGRLHYSNAMRRWVPAGDGLLVAGAVGLLALESGLRSPAARPGLAALGAAACLFLTFSGVIRMSHRAQRVATLLAVLDWTLLAIVLPVPALPATVVALVLVSLGIASNHLTRTVRRVVTFEVERERLDHMYQTARSAVEAREEALRMVAHDLRNPLSTIGLTAEMLIEMPVNDEQRRKHARTIERCGKTMDALIQDLLDFARMEAGRIEIEPQPTAVPDLLDRVVELMRPIAAANEVTLDAADPAGLPRVAVDPDRLVQVFSNLIGNAVKFTPAGGRVSIRTQRLGDRVRFAIADTGPGIPAERVSEIFQSFWQAKGSDRRGIGLGLAIARHIVEAHGERIGVESEAGGGSEFWFTAAVAD